MFALKGKAGFRLADGTFTRDRKKIHWYRHYLQASQDAVKYNCNAVSMEQLWYDLIEELELLKINEPIQQSTSEYVEEAYDNTKDWHDD